MSTSNPEHAVPLRAVHRWRLLAGDQSGPVSGEPSGAAADRLPEEASTLVATVEVDANDPNLRGHFPGFPIYPGVFIVETLCQAMGAAFGHNGQRPRLREVKSLRLTSPLEGGDELTMTANVTPHEQGWSVRAKGTRRDGRAAATVTAIFDRVAVS